MQQIIQSLQEDPGINPAQSPEKVRAVPPTAEPPLPDKHSDSQTASGGLPQDYTIQEDMQGLTGSLGGLFGM